MKNELGVIKRLLSSGVKTAQQIARRLTEMEFGYSAPLSSSTSLRPYQYMENKGCYKYVSNVDMKLAPQPSRDSYFKLGESIGKIKKILKSDSGVTIIADICSAPESFFSYPDDSRRYGVYQVSKWTDQDVQVNLQDISGKCMMLPIDKETWVAIHLLHTG